MHPPFYVVDHRVDPDPLPFEERRLMRRAAPARLAFDLPAPGTPILALRALTPPRPLPERAGGGWLARLAGLVRRPATA